MKRNILLIAFIAFSIAGCKKDIQSTTEQPVQSVNSTVICALQNWDLVSSYPNHGMGMVYNNKIYVPNRQTHTMKIYDGTSWTSIASDVPLLTYQYDVNDEDIVMFTLGTKGYMLLPWSPSNIHETDPGFWEYNFATNVWTKKANFPGTRRDNPAYFSIGTKGYLVSGGTNSSPVFDNWEYNQATNSWAQKASLPLFARSAATGFSIGTKGYIVCGRAEYSISPVYMQELREYDQASNSWTVKASFPGIARQSPSVFVISGKAYVGGGTAGPGNPLKDMYRYTPASNSWTQMLDMPYSSYYDFFGFTLNSKGYVVLNVNGNNALLKYSPEYCTTISPQIPAAGL